LADDPPPLYTEREREREREKGLSEEDALFAQKCLFFLENQRLEI
jgi:hypothetical protein